MSAPFAITPAIANAILADKLADVAAYVPGASDLFAEVADRLRRFEISQPEAGVLFDAPTIRPPGSFYAVRRVDGSGMGEEDAEWASCRDVAHGWLVAEKEADWLDGEAVEFEVVLMVPYRVGARCIGGKGKAA
jgi:hypothetical protein